MKKVHYILLLPKLMTDLQGGYNVRNVRMYGNENRGVRMGRNVRSVSKSVRFTEFGPLPAPTGVKKHFS